MSAHTHHDHVHSGRHAHGHDHGHGDPHGHAHDPDLVSPAFSVLRLSAAQRLAGALLLSAAIWAATWWAVH
ncbi:MAG: hypothetical protein U1E28_18815 [Beijerinckiaceae bacterium]